MKSVGIVVICYNRLDGIRRLIASLEKVDFEGREDIALIFSIDYSTENQSVKDFANNYCWAHGKKTVRAYDENQGLKKHILECGDLTSLYNILFVLEDDIYVSPSMFSYGYHAADFYYNDENIAGVSLYSFEKHWINPLCHFKPQPSGYDAYFLKIAQSWGQVWTLEKWRQFREWYKENMDWPLSDGLPAPLNAWNSSSSWLKFHDRYCIEKNKYFVYPYVSLSTNFSDAGTHSAHASSGSQVLLMGKKIEYMFPAFDDKAIVYDEFMERQHLEKYLGISEKDLCIDLYGTKPQRYCTKYVLSTQALNYKIIREYSLCLKPIELSVIEGIGGKGIYLYDTDIRKKNKDSKTKYVLIDYNYGIHSYSKLKELMRFSVYETWSSVVGKIKQRSVKK